MAESSAKITAPVKVPKGSVIELDARFYEDEHSSVEFSIIDETGETPVCPGVFPTSATKESFPGLTRDFLSIRCSCRHSKDGAPVDMTFEERQKRKPTTVYRLLQTERRLHLHCQNGRSTHQGGVER